MDETEIILKPETETERRLMAIIFWANLTHFVATGKRQIDIVYL
jgi:hypothetical protein